MRHAATAVARVSRCSSGDTFSTVVAESTPQAKLSFAEVVERLQEAYPKAFTTPPRPLQIGIHKIIRVAKPASLEGLANTTISKSIGRWVRRDAYLEAVSNREPRHDLEGRPVGNVSEEAAESATQALRRRKKKQAAQAKRHAAKAAAEQTQPSSTDAA